MRPEAAGGCAVTAAALLIDLDGVLVDSMPVIRQIFRDWARSNGLDSEQVLRAVHGRPTAEGLRQFVPQNELERHVEFLTREEVRRSDDMRCLPGARFLLSQLCPGSWAVVTSGTRVVAQARLRAAGLPTPTILVSADDVRAGKPAPDCYLLAARRLGVAPESCLVFEDAPAGVHAARAAGIPHIGVGRQFAADPPVTVVDSLADIQVSRNEGLLCIVL
jgi:sugar-phosphatase